jgi:hypothetical protein
VKMVGCHGFAPCSHRVRAGTSLSKVAAQAPERGRPVRFGLTEWHREGSMNGAPHQFLDVLSGLEERAPERGPLSPRESPAQSQQSNIARTRRSALQEMDGHESNALSIPVWKTGVYLSTLMPD